MGKKYETEEERLQARRDARKRWKEKHKDKVKEQAKLYRERHPEKRKEESKRRYAKYGEEIRKKRIEYYHSSIEKVKESQKEYRDSHPEIMRKWREENSEKLRAHNKVYHEKYQNTKFGRANNLIRAYRQRDKNHNRGECTLDEQWIIDNIFSSQCSYCNERDWHKLGCDRKDNSLPHTPDNCIPCCSTCNTKKGRMNYDEYMQKILGEQTS